MSNSKKHAISSACVLQSRENATLHNKLMMLDWYHANDKNQSKTARHFKENGFSYMKQPLVSAWVKDEPNLCAQANTMHDLTSKCICTICNSDFDKALIILFKRQNRVE
ncbi:hypothetical protein G9A89_002875 [Geosiphon pyriformis]|nr:hypothetical protein G9A89_002875 [Geosiphon pyriformis]